jgi:hypothetical protein
MALGGIRRRRVAKVTVDILDIIRQGRRGIRSIKPELFNHPEEAVTGLRYGSRRRHCRAAEQKRVMALTVCIFTVVRDRGRYDVFPLSSIMKTACSRARQHGRVVPVWERLDAPGLRICRIKFENVFCLCIHGCRFWLVSLARLYIIVIVAWLRFGRLCCFRA